MMPLNVDSTQQSRHTFNHPLNPQGTGPSAASAYWDERLNDLCHMISSLELWTLTIVLF